MCDISITSVIGAINPGGTVPTSIKVTGKAADCSSGLVDVKVTCGGPSMSLTVPADAAGAWTAKFTTGAGQCPCTKPIQVVASCTSDRSCFDELQEPLRCEVGPGPCGDSVGDLTVVVSGCAGGPTGGTANATFTFTIVPPLPGCTYRWNFGDGSPIVNSAVPTVTHVYSSAGSFNATVVATCPTSGDPCVIRDSVDVIIPSCCPTVTNLTTSMTGCADPGVVTVTFAGTLTPVLAGCTFLWQFGDGSPAVITTVPSVTHIYTTAGTFPAAVTASCPNIPICATATILVVIPPCCTTVTAIVSNVSDNECAGASSSATVNFSATTNPPAAAPGDYTWDFGDGASITNSGPNASHPYAVPGTFPVKVTYVPNPPLAGCAPSSKTATVTVPPCKGPPPPPPQPGNGGEGVGCLGLRIVMTIAAILAIVAVSLAICIPPAATPLLILALVLGIIAAVAGIVWAFLCPRPCAWPMLLAWQVSLGVGLILLCFTVCCPTFWLIGGGLVVAGVALMLAWKRRCKKSNCAVLKELVIAVSGVILPLLGWFLAIPALAACINTLITGILSTVAAAISVSASQCT
jgi:hypothetical protein